MENISFTYALLLHPLRNLEHPDDEVALELAKVAADAPRLHGIPYVGVRLPGEIQVVYNRTSIKKM